MDMKTDEQKKRSPDSKILVQIYEIQTPGEAEKMIELCVDRIGSVVPSIDNWKDPLIREAIRLKAGTTVRNSLIPLYSDPDMIYRTADYYEPDVMHFCEALSDQRGIRNKVKDLIKLHEGFHKRFPEIDIMRTIPVAPEGKAPHVPTLELTKLFEAVSDWILTDTLLLGEAEGPSVEQPEAGFLGITGKTCDWEMAKKLVDNCGKPVILAGGISPGNVYEAIMAVQPAGVDSCTNTNLLDPNGHNIRFKKDPEKVKRLIDAVRRAENEIKHKEEDVESHV